MLNTRTENNKKIALVMLAIMLSASVISLGSRAFAQDHAVAEQTGMNRVIAGTEDWNGKYDISASKFFQNIGKSTGIYKMIHKQTAEEIAALGSQQRSRILKIKLDEEKKEITEFHEFYVENFFTPSMGSVQVLDNDTNTILVDWGTKGREGMPFCQEINFNENKVNFELIFHIYFAF